MFYKIWDFLLLIVVLCELTNADTFEECEGKDQAYMELKDDCSFYIFCHGEESFSDSCPDDSPYFSIEEQTCDTNRTVCKDRAIIKEASTLEEEEQVFTTASSSASTNFSSVSTITIPTTDPSTNSSSSTAFVVSSTTSFSSTNFTEMHFSTTALPSTVAPPFYCPAVDNPNRLIFLPHSKSCSDYFLCYRGERLPMHCSKMLHFDVRQQKCDYPENVKCQMMDVASAREQCLPHTFDFYPHPRNCNYYYQCILGYLKVMQCPLNMGWHYEKRTCVRRSQAKCYNPDLLKIK